MGANYSFYVKFIATFALTFFGYIISVLASVSIQYHLFDQKDFPCFLVNGFDFVATKILGPSGTPVPFCMYSTIAPPFTSPPVDAIYNYICLFVYVLCLLG